MSILKPITLNLCALGLILAASGPAVSAVTYSSSAIASNLRDISGTGTPFSLGDDQVTGAVSIGFSFDFYGTTYTDAYISSNGFMTFDGGSSSGCCTGQVLGDTLQLDNLIAGLWEDLDTNGGADGDMFYQTTGAVGSREFTVGFYDVGHFPSGSPVTFEMILKEGSNDIELQYGRVSDDGGTHTIGITNTGDGADAVTWYRGSNPAQYSNTGVLFTASEQVPVPAPLLLIGLGLSALAWRSRKSV